MRSSTLPTSARSIGIQRSVVALLCVVFLTLATPSFAHLTKDAQGRLLPCPCEQAGRVCKCEWFGADWRAPGGPGKSTGHSASEVAQDVARCKAAYPNDPYWRNPGPVYCEGCSNNQSTTSTTAGRMKEEAKRHLDGLGKELAPILDAMRLIKKYLPGTDGLPNRFRDVGQALKEYSDNYKKAFQRLRELRLKLEQATDTGQIRALILQMDEAEDQLRQSSATIETAMEHAESLPATMPTPAAPPSPAPSGPVETLTGEEMATFPTVEVAAGELRTNNVHGTLRDMTSSLADELINANANRNNGNKAKPFLDGADRLVDGYTPAQAAWAVKYFQERIKAENPQDEVLHGFEDAIRRLTPKASSVKPIAPSVPSTPAISIGKQAPDPGLVALRTPLAQLNTKTRALRDSSQSFSDVSKAPVGIQQQYLRVMNAIEKRDMEAMTKVMASDYYLKSEDGTIQPFTKWKAATVAAWKGASTLQARTQVESIERKNGDYVVTAHLNYATNGNDQSDKLKVRETWMQSGSMWKLQSTEVLSSETEATGSSLAAKPGVATANKPLETQAATSDPPGADAILDSKAIGKTRYTPTVDDYDMVLAQTVEQVKQKSVTEFQALAHKLVLLNPDRYEGHLYLGLAYLRQEDYNAAEASLKMALTHAPDAKKREISAVLALVPSTRTYNSAVKEADAALKDGLKSKAARKYAEAANALPTHTDIALIASQLYMELGEYAEAASLATLAAADDKNSEIAHQANLILGKIAPQLEKIYADFVAQASDAYKKGDNEKSISLLQKAVNVCPTQSNAYYLLASKYVVAGQEEQANSILLQGIKKAGLKIDFIVTGLLSADAAQAKDGGKITEQFLASSKFKQLVLDVYGPSQTAAIGEKIAKYHQLLTAKAEEASLRASLETQDLRENSSGIIYVDPDRKNSLRDAMKTAPAHALLVLRPGVYTSDGMFPTAVPMALVCSDPAGKAVVDMDMLCGSTIELQGITVRSISTGYGHRSNLVANNCKFYAGVTINDGEAKMSNCVLRQFMRNGFPPSYPQHNLSVGEHCKIEMDRCDIGGCCKELVTCSGGEVYLRHCQIRPTKLDGDYPGAVEAPAPSVLGPPLTYGIGALDGSSLNIEDSEISGCHSGLTFYGVNATLKKCTISQCHFGIQLRDTSNVNTIECTFTNNHRNTEKF